MKKLLYIITLSLAALTTAFAVSDKQAMSKQESKMTKAQYHRALSEMTPETTEDKAAAELILEANANYEGVVFNKKTTLHLRFHKLAMYLLVIGKGKFNPNWVAIMDKNISPLFTTRIPDVTPVNSPPSPTR